MISGRQSRSKRLVVLACSGHFSFDFLHMMGQPRLAVSLNLTSLNAAARAEALCNILNNSRLHDIGR